MYFWHIGDKNKYCNVYFQIVHLIIQQIVRLAVMFGGFIRTPYVSVCLLICSDILTDYASVDSPFSRCAALTKWRLVSLK